MKNLIPLKSLYLLILSFVMLVTVGYGYYALNHIDKDAYVLVNSWGQKGLKDGEFLYIEDFALDQNGNILVTDALRADVQVFTPNGKFITKFSVSAPHTRSVNKPEGIAIDKEGNIYISDYLYGHIKKFDKNYNYIKTFGSYGDGPGKTAEIEFLCIHPHNGFLYLAEAGNSRISVFDSEGAFKFSFGEHGIEKGQMIRPKSAECANNGDIYVADFGNNRIQIFDKKGNFIKIWGSEGKEPGQFRKPRSLAFDADNNIYIAESGNNRIQKFDKHENFISMWGGHGYEDGEFDNLHGIIVDKEGNIYVADTGNNRIQKFALKKQKNVN